MSEASNTIVLNLLDRKDESIKLAQRRRLINAHLLCIANGWDFLRISSGNERMYSYQDREPSPTGTGGLVHNGTLVYYNPNPGQNANHFQLYTQSGIPDYCGRLDLALQLGKLLLPRASFTIYAANEAFGFQTRASVDFPNASRASIWSGPEHYENEAEALLSAVFNALKS